MTEIKRRPKKQTDHTVRSRGLRGSWWGNALRVGFVFFLLALTLFPLYYLVMSSLKSHGEWQQNLFLPPQQGWRFDNWWAVLDKVTQPAMNSIIIAGATVAIMLVIMTPCAYVFAFHVFPGKEKLFGFAIAVMLLPSILTFVPLYILVRDLGLLGTKWAVIFPAVAGGISVTLFLLRTFFSALPNDLVEAARVDGARELQILVRIILPLMMPALVTVSVLTIANVWNLYLWPLVTLTNPADRVASVAVTFFAPNQFLHQSVPLMMSAYLMSSLPLIVIMAVLLRYFMAGATQGAIKG